MPAWTALDSVCSPAENQTEACAGIPLTRP
jgi:hypothetical protein